MAKRESRYHGLLIVDKPGFSQTDSVTNSITSQQVTGDAVSISGAAPVGEQAERLLTSHDVVQRVRRWSDQRRIGHTGTLDPMASGVLVLCLGHATRLVEYYQGHDKQYWAEVRLGRATDTYDRMGVTTERAAVPHLTEERIERALARFRGHTEQIPPVYSALKQGGESLHRKARRGEEVTVAPRPVSFYDIILLDYNQPVVGANDTGTSNAGANNTGANDAGANNTGTSNAGANNIGENSGDADEREPVLHLRVRCSAGAYIRTLAHDIGLALGTRAHLSGLRREMAGAFSLSQGYTLNAIERAAGEGKLENLLLAPGDGLALPSLTLDAEIAQRLGYGQKVIISQTPSVELARALDERQRFLGIIRNLKPAAPQSEGEAEMGDAAFVWKAEKWLAEN